MINPVDMPYSPPPLTALEVLYEDDWCIAVNKPSGLLSVPGRGPNKQDCVHSRLLKQAPNARVVHRLDMGTSGILLFAQHYEAQKRLSQHFADRKVSKKYIAIVSGHVETLSGTIDAPMCGDWENRPRQMICESRGKASKTLFQVAERNSSQTRIALTPVTGRTHQLRLHMQHIGHPILGDELYATEADIQAASRLLLHASELEFPHPDTQEIVHIHSSPTF